jgi:hypothetical protein
MTAQYTYLATDLVSNAILGELPVNNVSLDCQLNQAGNMSAGGKLSDRRIGDDEFIARTVPGRTAFWAIRENQVVWGGIILSREYQSNGKSLTLTGQTFECYAYRRFPRAVIGKTVTQKLSMGRCAMINYLWGQLQSTQGGSIGVLDAAVPSVDPVTALTVNGYDLSTSNGNYIDSLTHLSDGPDWTIAWGIAPNGSPFKQLQVGVPIGNTIDLTDLEVDYPGSVMNYTYTENASEGANQWWGVGNGSGPGTVEGSATDWNNVDSGYPLWEGVNNYDGVTATATASAHAASDLQQHPMPQTTHAATFAGGTKPQFGSYGLGDYCIFNVKDERFPTGQQIKVRVIGWTIQPPDEGQGVESINPVFDEPTGVVAGGA